jgi:hypothetical protein
VACHCVVLFAFSYPVHSFLYSLYFCSRVISFWLFFHIRVIPFCCIIYIFVSRSSLFFLYILVLPFCSIVVLFSYSGHPFLLYFYAFLYRAIYLCCIIYI